MSVINKKKIRVNILKIMRRLYKSIYIFNNGHSEFGGLKEKFLYLLFYKAL